MPADDVAEGAPSTTSTSNPRHRSVWNGFGDGMAQAFELVVTPLLFALLGVWIDGRLGTEPAFTVGLLVFALIGATVSAYFRYQARMAEHERGKPWAR